MEVFALGEALLLLLVRTGSKVWLEARARNPWQSISFDPPGGWRLPLALGGSRDQVERDGNGQTGRVGPYGL